MRVSRDQLAALLEKNALELRFFRRNEKPGWSSARRMLVTNDKEILNSVPGRVALDYKRPTHYPSYNPKTRGLVCGYDLFWQDFRMIPAESCNVITIIPTRPVEKFWNYFNIYLQSMSVNEKVSFMNK